MTPKWKKGLAVFLCAAMIASGSMAVSADEGEPLPPQTNVETDATTPDGTTPGETTPDGTTPDGTTPGGTTPDGTTPDGTTPGGTTPDGTTPDGTTPGETTPDGTTPDGTTPEGTTPNGVAPYGNLVTLQNTVATVNGTGYETLQEAVDAADGSTVTLTQDVDISTSGLKINNSITLDLSGYEIKAANSYDTNIQVTGTLVLDDSKGGGRVYSESPYGDGMTTGIIAVNGSFIMKGGTVYTVMSDATNKGQFGILAAANSHITINGGKIEAGWYAISGNGLSSDGAEINITGGELISTADYAVYQPHDGIVKISGGTIYGAAGGLAINKGKLQVTGGTITSVGKGDTGNWGDGTGGMANAAVNLNAEYGDVEAELSGGTFISEGDAVVISTTSSNVVDLSITGGTYQGTGSDTISKYIQEGYILDATGTVVSKTDGNYQVIDEDTLKKALSDGIKNIQLAENIAVTTAITIPAGVTLDGGGHTLSLTETVANGAFVTAGKDADNVTIQNITVDAGTNAKHGIQFYCAKGGKLSNVTVKGGYYTSVQVNGSEVEISNCNLQPTNKEPGKSYANIEYSMGKGVTTVPKLQISNVTGDTSGGRPLVYMDQNTVDSIIANAGTNGLKGITRDSTIQEIVNALYEHNFNNATSIAVNSTKNPGNYVPEGAVPSPDPDPTPKPEDKPSSGNSSSSSGSSSSGNGGSSTPFVSVFTKKLEALKEKENASRVVLKDKKTNVTVSGEKGVLSADLKLKVTKVDEIASSLSDKLGTFLLYDIKLVDENGNTVQPKGTVTVGIPVPEGFDIDKLVVYYIDEEGNLIEYPVVVKDGVAYFETDHFSYYALAEKQGNSLTTQSTTETQTDSNKPNPSTGAQDLTAVLAAAAVSLMGLVVLGKKKR